MRPLLFPLAAFAAPQTALAQAAPAVPDAAGSIAQVLLGLAAVVLLLFAALYLLKRLSAPRGAAAGMLKVLSATAVGSRERVVLVQVGDTWLVLGVAPGSVNALHTLPRQELPATPQGAAAAGKDFGAWLRQAPERKHAR
ncbi:MAG: flagellar biosynthetic protein FliO [Pseudomonadota bacterium]